MSFDVEKDLTRQVAEGLDNFLNKKNTKGNLPHQVEGDRYYISAGHSSSNILIFTALSALLGSQPQLLVIGTSERRFNHYEYKQTANVKGWHQRWRSEMRMKYILPETEIFELSTTKEQPA
jgi:hypothetical protein